MLNLFPFAMLTWRESVIGFQPVEMTYMQVQHDWVSASMPGYHNYGLGYAMGENLGAIKWRMTEDLVDGKRLRTLRSESFERKTERQQIEETTVEVGTNRIVRQVEQSGRSRSVCTFFADHIQNRRTDATDARRRWTCFRVREWSPSSDGSSRLGRRRKSS